MKTTYLKLFSRDFSVQYNEMNIKCVFPAYRKHIPTWKGELFIVPENGKVTTCVNEQAWKKYMKLVTKRYGSSTGFKTFFKGFHYYGINVLKTARAVSYGKLEKLTKNDLWHRYSKFQEAWTPYMSYLWTGWILNDVLADKAQTILELKSLPDKESSALINALCAPTKKVGILKLQSELGKYKKQGIKNLSPQKIASLVKHYSYIPCLDFHNTPWQEKDIVHLYNTLEIPAPPLSFAKAAHLSKLTNKERNFFKQVQTVAYIKDMRDVFRRQGAHAVMPLLDEMAKRQKVTRKQIVYSTTQELANAFLHSKPLPLAEIAKRMHGYVLYKKDKRLYFSTKTSDIQKYSNKIAFKSASILKGIGASLGYAKGKARIILSSADLITVKPGEILIAVTTHPEFVPAMQIARAIVTDEGGLTSHAAIVSRELGIPCLVRTHHASKIFKNGDMVEVDANKGIVRKL